MRISLRAGLDDAGAYAVLCHELAHVYLGHVGADRDGWWPFRMNVTEAVAEIEAESVAYIVCARAGLRTHSAEYLSSFVEDSEDLDAISLDLISRVAARLEGYWGADCCRREPAPVCDPGKGDHTFQCSSSTRPGSSAKLLASG